MIKIDKTYTSNPFVDNLIYYTKTMALNCTIKDEEEALAYETKESLMNGDTYIACIENRAKYEMFRYIDKKILSKYIEEDSNLNIFAKDPSALLLHLDSLGVFKKNQIVSNLSKMARSIYIDHYDIITNYIDEIGESWGIDNKPLYDKCVDGSADYNDLFNVLPRHTLLRIIKEYLHNYDNSNIEEITESLEAFNEYVNNRTDHDINSDLENINIAMSSVFKDHYEIMIERGYISNNYNNYFGEYVYFVDVYNRCKTNNITYTELYPLFPDDVLKQILENTLGVDTVNTYNLLLGVKTLTYYFDTYSTDPINEINNLNKAMIDDYINHYNIFVNYDIYNKCKNELLDYFDLTKYLPYETLKIILNVEIEEITNIEVYSNNKEMLNSYLNGIDKTKAYEIKQNIANDMREYFVSSYEELNNYYRTFVGLPKLNDSNEVYEDTLYRTYDTDNGEFIYFNDMTWIDTLSEATTYPKSHWRTPLYMYDEHDISILKEYGILEEYLYECKKRIKNSDRYEYINYLGDSKLDIYTCRKAMNFDLIGIPTIDSTEAKDMFVDAYVLNRDYILRTIYSDAYKFQSKYYNKFIMIFIILNTIMDVLTEIPEMIIDRKVFDSRCVRYLFEANGIPYYSEIPLKYQQAMLKNLNILIKYKSSTRNMVDICNLFGFPDIKVFGYYMLKSIEVDPHTGEYLFEENNRLQYDPNALYIKDINGNYLDYNSIRYSKLSEYRNYSEDIYFDTITVVSDDGSAKEQKVLKNTDNLYLMDSNNNDIFIPLKESDYFTKIKKDIKPTDLKFIKVPVNEDITEYKNDTDYIINYDELVAQDEGNTWDGGLEHEYLKQKILDYEFNAVKTKYVSVETITHMTDLSFQVSFFYNMIFDNLYNEDALTVDIPYIRSGHKFRFMDVICYLFALMYLYNGLEDNIMYSPTQMLYIKGYNFKEDTNKIISDITAFDKDPNVQYNQAENIYEYNESIKNIFDINKEIQENGYDYQKAFENYNIKGFNLQADIDAIDKWLSENYQMSVDDFIVDDSLTVFDHIITLRQFFSLNNLYYQKSIFNENLKPSKWNQDLKYAFDCTLYDKLYIQDINKVTHEFIIDTINSSNKEYIELINDTNDSIYVVDSKRCVIYKNMKYTIYRKYTKTEFINDNNERVFNYVLDGFDYYILYEGSLKCIMHGDQYIVNSNKEYIFAADAYYKKVNKNEPEILNTWYAVNVETDIVEENLYLHDTEGGITHFMSTDSYLPNEVDSNISTQNADVSVDDTGEDEYEFRLIDKDMYFYTDDNNNKVLKFAIEYYDYNEETDHYDLKEDNCYVQVVRDGEIEYVLVKDLSKLETTIISMDNCFVRHSDGHFISMVETDLYRRINNGIFEYDESETLYIKSSTPTKYYDPTADPVVYYQKLNDYYDETGYTILTDVLYVKLPDGSYIRETELISPNICYFLDEDGEYKLVAKHLLELEDITNNFPSNDNILVLDINNNYYLYIKDKYDYMYTQTPLKQYVKDSDTEKILVLNLDKTYSTTSKIIVVFNKDVVGDLSDEEINGLYNPEETDNIWDENDWYYEATGEGSNTKLKMNGENKWYYRKPGSIIDTPKKDDTDEPAIGSGFYFSAETYLGDLEIENGVIYYLAFDIETNFNGKIQIYNTADSSCKNVSDRNYTVTEGAVQHIAQTFIADTSNGNSRPSLRFLIYDFVNYPIENGDYIIISNIRMVRGCSEYSISQDIPSYDKLQELYKTNEAIYKYLVSLMNNCSDYDTYVIYKKLYDSLMVTKYNKEAFKLSDGTYAKTYTDFLKTRDAVLYERLSYFKSLDVESMHKEVADNIVQVTYSIDDCIDIYNYSYLYSYFPAVSAGYIQQYISKVINFFKSWKTHLLGINTVYKFDDKFENTIKILHDLECRTRKKAISSVHIMDGVKINPIDSKNPQGYDYSELYKDNDFVKYTNECVDKVMIKDRIRLISRTANKIEFTDNFENMHLVLNDDNIKVKTEDNNLKISSPDNIGFKVANLNELVMNTDETDDDVFTSQILEEITKSSIDILDWSDTYE